MITIIVTAGIVFGLLMTFAVGMKRRSEHNAEVRHYQEHKRSLP